MGRGARGLRGSRGSRGFSRYPDRVGLEISDRVRRCVKDYALRNSNTYLSRHN